LLALIQARSNSRRFKNKILCHIFEKSLIEHVIDSVKKSNKIKKIVVATSVNKSDRKLVYFLKKKKINFYKGNLNNVALRLVNAAKKNNAKFFLRVNADSPLIDYTLINKAINIHRKNISSDLITNVFPRTFPSGQSIEIIRTDVLAQNIKFMSKDEKEHVSKYFYKYNTKFFIKNFKCTPNYKYKHLKKMTIDYKSDIKKIKHLINEN
tara:strand:+ start:5347 stop:5973 length:627 start_codon:yes stop_codon:yes gene_type:complete